MVIDELRHPGFSDSVYAEACVTVQQFDIILGKSFCCDLPSTNADIRSLTTQTDVLVVNQTDETLRDLTIDFATLGDLKLVERPVPQTLAPHGFHSIKATIKVSMSEATMRLFRLTNDRLQQVSSTETGVIFGNVVYEKQGASDSSVNIVLNDIHVDIMDYIKPAYCNEAQVCGCGQLAFR